MINFSEEESLQWESEKYSSKTVSVFPLDSGRFVIAKQNLEVVAVCSAPEASAILAASLVPAPYVSPLRRGGLADLVLDF